MAHPDTQPHTPLRRRRLSPDNRILVGLIAPSIMTGMAHHMFNVALPAIRNDFAIDADVAAWVVMAYTLPFIAFMPLYGRMGDRLGNRLLLLLGVTIFSLGTLVILSAQSLPALLLGRVIQGAGSAGFVPLCLAIISRRFPPQRVGQVMGTWNSVIPLVGLSVPYLAGLLIDRWGWISIYPPLFLAGLGSFLLIRTFIPTRSGPPDLRFLRQFDWPGVLLLTAGLTSLLFFTASRPITGRPALRDPRLFLSMILCFGLFVVWERRRRRPYLNLQIFRNTPFTLSSVVAGLRMFLMSGISFLLPLYLADIHRSDASTIGLALALQAAALFLISRGGGEIADRWGSRIPIVLSMLGLILVMGGLALLPVDAPMALILGLSIAHGLIIGLSLAPLHRSAIHQVDAEEIGMAAGLYSMLRFAGQVLGTAVAGVLLQQGLAAGLPALSAYQNVFWLHTGIAVLGALLGLGIREKV